MSATFGVLSVLACFIVFITYLLFKDLRTEPRTLVLILSICDFFQALFFCIVGPHDGMACSFLSAYGIFCGDTVAFWTVD